MCGRYTLTRPGDVLDPLAGDELAGIELEPGTELRPRYNIAPTQPALIVRAPFGAPRVAPVRFGLVPSAGASRRPAPLINARLETARDKPSFRDSLRRRRCLVPAHGFYEWRRLGTRGAGTQPYYLSGRGDELLAFAGLWHRVPAGAAGERPIESMCILTMAPNPLVAELHDRMPVILPRALWRPWLHAEQPEIEELITRLVPYPAERMRRRPVGARVNAVANDDPSCLDEAAEAPRTLPLF